MNITEQKFELHKSCGHLSQLQPLYCKVPSGEPWRLMGFKALTMKCNILDLNLSLFQHQLPNKEKKNNVKIASLSCYRYTGEGMKHCPVKPN